MGNRLQHIRNQLAWHENQLNINGNEDERHRHAQIIDQLRGLEKEELANG